MGTQTTNQKNKALRKYERRWVKPTIITTIIVLIPLMLVAFFKGPTIVRAINNHNASFSEAWRVTQREDTGEYFANTPNSKTDPIVTSESDIDQSEPNLILFFLHHCPYCEAGHPYVEGRRQEFVENYPEYADNVFYMDVAKGYGKELVQEYNVQASSTMMILNNGEATLNPYADMGSNGIMQQEDNIAETFEQFESLLTEN